MLGIALLGGVANFAAFCALAGARSLNERGARVHVLSDLLGSLAASIAALLIIGRGWTIADPLLSLAVAALIWRSAWALTRESADVLLESAPPSFEVERVEAVLVGHVPGLVGIHHVHVWPMTGERPTVTLHANLARGTEHHVALTAIHARLARATARGALYGADRRGSVRDPRLLAGRAPRAPRRLSASDSRHRRLDWRPENCMGQGRTLRRHSVTAAWLLAGVCAGGPALADESGAGAGLPGPDSYWPQLLGAQYTYVLQHQTALDAAYSGPLSLNPRGDTQSTHTIGFYGGWAALSWAQLYLDTEKFMGAGVSGATGLGGLTNGDVVREGAAGLKKTFYIARAYLRLMLPLAGELTHADRAQDQIGGNEPATRLEFKAGRLSVTDDFDHNRYASTTRTEFMNWSLWANTAWDYAANTRGYTDGVVLELRKPGMVAALRPVSHADPGQRPDARDTEPCTGTEP